MHPIHHNGERYVIIGSSIFVERFGLLLYVTRPSIYGLFGIKKGK